MIAFLPLWILGVPLVLALIDLMATRSGARDVEYDAPVVRETGVHREFRRGDKSSPVVGRPLHDPVLDDSRANIS